MLFTNIFTASILLSSASCLPSSQSPLEESVANDNGPSPKYACENAQHVFNAIHGAMRQWDSSLKHNGMSYFAATIPNNTLLYHGTGSKEPVKTMEWLAFEIEHAEMFARGRRGGPGRGPGRRPPGEGPPGGGEPGNGAPPPPFTFMEEDSNAADENLEQHGYLHTYRTSRALTKLLYLDGMSAGKTSMGTLDTQDLVLGDPSKSPGSNPNGDYGRAQVLCAIGAEAGIEGFIRMEAGFELILCNFTDGLEFVSAFSRPDQNRGPGPGMSEMAQFEYVRGVAARYHGIGGGRVAVDYSSMVSAFFYNLNLTNPDPKKADLPRLTSTNPSEREHIKSDVISLFSPTNSQHTVIDWQGITDMIITRYSDRLQFLASNNLTNSTMLSEINFLLNVYIDYTNPTISTAIEKCTNIYLTPAIPATIADHLIHASLSAVSRQICSTLFEVRTILLSESTEAVEKVNQAVNDLIEYLDWPVWLECGKCAWDEVCFVAIWPWGAPEDHEKPGCRGFDDLRSRRGYWDFGVYEIGFGLLICGREM
ncbi:uncharacterized protein LY89DRAFT_712269 [Mollisia scopiformis]|uniref:Uncharacterized protein n=1 Tax=Mollisia scopiformis TaxID=149040 RepID=A0A132B5J0_MOLSC|nr:uncharacterized protein LY89DRAFT_712269 [Mollisia scopiformis]KUJ06937.1 hypothetical protein LY89DRAFT_712269 [Mollisia scopiformis]